MVAFLKRMPAGVPGNLTRVGSGADVETQIVDASNAPTAYGVAVAIDSTSGGVRPIGSGDTATNVYGVLVRPYPTAGNGTDGLGTSTPPTSGIVSVLKRGYINVKLDGATAAAKGGAVYVRVAAAASGKPIGGFEAAADSTNTIQVSGAYFTGPADSNGNAEIAFNV